MNRGERFERAKSNIAQNANVGDSSIYQYFEDKKELFSIARVGASATLKKLNERMSIGDRPP
jgi:AcrR family transcriptional regulator